MNEEALVFSNERQFEISSVVQVLNCDIEWIQANFTHTSPPLPNTVMLDINKIQKWTINIYQTIGYLFDDTIILNINQYVI